MNKKFIILGFIILFIISAFAYFFTYQPYVEKKMLQKDYILLVDFCERTIAEEKKQKKSFWLQEHGLVHQIMRIKRWVGA